MLKRNLIKQAFLYLVPLVIAGWCVVAMQGCKDPVIESTNLLRKSDSLNLQKDTLAINVVTEPQTSLVSSGVSQGVLGCMYDRSFGTMYCSIYGQLPNLSSLGAAPAGAVVDSVVLTLQYNGQYGLCHKPIDLAVYALADTMSIYPSYYTNSTFRVKTPALGVLHNFVPDFVDSVPVLVAGSIIYQAPHIRIPLSLNYGNQIAFDSAALIDDSLFSARYKGLYIVPTSSSTGDGIMYINLLSPLSGLNVYYHYNYLGTTYPGDFEFTFEGGQIVNHYDCANHGTPIAAALQNPATAQKVFLEAGSAAQGKITFQLDSILKTGLLGKIGINKAELVLSQSPAASDTQYAAPIQLNLLRIDDAGVGQSLDDVAYTTYGGVLTLETASPGLNINRYRFNITRYFQKLVQGVYNNNGLYLTVVNGFDVADRVVIANPSNSPDPVFAKNYKISLSVTYTKL